jgi:hypothetical protein
MSENTFSIDTLLEQMVAHDASDLHLTVGSHPALRVRGQLQRLEGFPVLTAEQTRELLDAGVDGVIFSLPDVYDLDALALAGETLAPLVATKVA